MAVAAVPVALSTASVWPEPAGVAFELAAELGYDGVEVMVWTDPVSQDVPRIAALSARYGVPVLALHAPCLLITQRVWVADPARRLDLSVRAAATLGAGTVVVHPPFRWQRRYAAGFADQVAELDRGGVRVAVENMFPVRRGSVAVSSYSPTPDPTQVGHRHYTLDLSHTASARTDALALAGRMGEGLVHLHLADGTGLPSDEHLVPGHGTQPCAEVCAAFAAAGRGTATLEVSTRRARNRSQRRAALAESLSFARRHLVAPAAAGAP